jgi:peptidoglycan/xylan/chitin deacetylase (PgdA/CDA1 family)
MRVAMRSWILVAAGVVVTLAMPGSGMAAHRTVRSSVVRPLAVRAASVTQDGRQLVWYVRLTSRFSPSALGRDHRSLCLVIERPRTASVSGVLCIEPPRRGTSARLVFSRVTVHGRGAGTVIAAVLSRSGASDLTARFLPSAVGRSYASFRWQVASGVDPSRCNSGCTAWFPAMPALARMHTPRLVGCVPSGSPLVYSGSRTRRVIALTFDDGPWPDTPQFLGVLEREHVVATFFQIGEQIGTYGRAVDRRMLADGDMIGDHTWSHATISGAGPLAAAQISQAAGAISAATGGFQPCLLRPPGGAVSSALVAEARAMGYTTINWDIDPRDWARPGVGAIVSNVLANAHAGAIVIQHDGGGDRSQTLAALPQEIDALRGRGYQFVTITELLGQQLVYK